MKKEYNYEEVIDFISGEMCIDPNIIEEVLMLELQYMRSLGLVVDFEKGGRIMSKSMLILDDFPKCCVECPFKYTREEMHLGNFTYKNLYRCMFEPHYLSEDDGDIVYLNDIMMDGKPPWCPLKEIKDVED